MKLSITLLAALAALCSGQVVPNPCPNGYENFSLDEVTPVCIKFAMYGKGTWHDLQAMCQAEGAQLAELKGELHWEVIRYINNNPDLMDEVFWIGGTDEGHEGYWVWYAGQDPMQMGIPHWYPGQPNNGIKQNCACLYTPDFYFHSLDCNAKVYALCQI